MSTRHAASVVDDEHVALDLLYKRWGDNSTRELNLWDAKGPIIEVEYHHDFTAGDRYVFTVTDRVVQELVRLGYVHGTPAWGYTDKRRLRLTVLGVSALLLAREGACMSWRVSAEDWLRT